MRKVIKSPKDCSETDLKLFKNLVNENGEVSTIGLDSRILNAENLIFIYDDQDILTAVGAIKRPNARYKSDVFEKVGYSANIEFELGWLSVSKTARGKGYGRILMESICKALSNTPCFATTRENNTAMHKLFNEFSFSKTGNPYKSDRGDYSLVLYLKK